MDEDTYTPCEKCGEPAAFGSVGGTCAHAGRVTGPIAPMNDREREAWRQAGKYQTEWRSADERIAVLERERNALAVKNANQVRMVETYRADIDELERERDALRKHLDALMGAARTVVKCEYEDFNDALEALDDAFRAAEHIAANGAKD